MKADAVFEGGGVKGIAFVGAICCLEEYGYKWERLAGTSAGSIVAALLAAGYTGKELREIIYNLDYTKLLAKNKIQSVPAVGKTLGLLKDKGIYSTSYIETWIHRLLKAKGKITFQDVSVNGISSLKIIASDITKREILILPDDLVKYNIDPLKFEISKAVQMSISIPLYFNPVKLTYDTGNSLIVDGGILSNFPIWIFDVKGAPRWPTIGFKLTENTTGKLASGKTDLVSYLLDMINTVVERNEEIYVNDRDAVRTINIPTPGIKWTQFDLSREDSQKLYNSGYNMAKEFINSWDFEEYIKKYRHSKKFA